MVGISKEHMRRVLHVTEEVGPTLWPYAAMYVADFMRQLHWKTLEPTSFWRIGRSNQARTK
eukprot:12935810-Prorocentrum_lima.AAC.1